jgi:hypothetical protein
MALKVAQTFYIDKTIVRDSETVSLDSIDLYFKSKPRSTGNRSGITNPGVTISIMMVQDNDIPDITKVIETSVTRVEYDSIIPSSDASIRTKFKFSAPVIVKTNTTYSVGISYDGSEEFEVWTCREGETLVDTNTITSGASARNVGKYFEFTGTTDTGTWKPLTNVDLKFSVFAATYSSNTSANTISNTYLLPCNPTEYIMFDRYNTKTNKFNSFQIGEMVFQETPVIYGPISVDSTSTSIKSTGSGINFSTLLPSPPVGDETTLSIDPVVSQKQYIVLRNGSTQAANVDVVEVASVVSNTEIQVVRLPKFSSNTATFSISAAGQLEYLGEYFYTGRLFDQTSNTFTSCVGRKTDILRVSDSNANSSIRFSNNIVEGIAINSGGIGYSNSDVVTVYPILDSNTSDPSNIAYIPAYANATANVVTNGSGTITGISVTNSGFGMTSNVALTISTSGGTSANLIPDVGCSVRGAQSNSMVGGCVITNVPVHRTYPDIRIISNQHHTERVIQHFGYYVTPGLEHVLNSSNPAMDREVRLNVNNPTFDFENNDGRVYVLASRSNEAVSSSNVVVHLANGSNFSTKVKSSSIVELSVTSNNAFTIPTVQTGQVYNYSYIINDDITGERKGIGKALARHISEKVTFVENRSAEDVVVYLDAYRPDGTDINVYVRLHSNSDQETFDDKDWTHLEIKSNNSSLTSSLTDEKDIIEFTYGLPTCPESLSTISGDVTVSNGQANVVGIGTTFTVDLHVNDVVKIWSELFPEDYMISVVRSIANNTLISIDDVVTDIGLTTGNMKIDIIGRPNDGVNEEAGNPFQAFTYVPNSYICRYYDSAMGKHDTYNTFQVKLVLTSNNESIVPKIWNIRAVGVSA